VTPVLSHLGMCGKSRPPPGWVMARQPHEAIETMLSPSGCNPKELTAPHEALGGARGLSAASRPWGNPAEVPADPLLPARR
jgi:hypothetical protein